MIKKFKEFLTEARKNPDKNPKISAYEALKKYKDDPDIYISFTELKKIGIKPIAEYNTPNGIYTYPLKEIWEDIEDDKGTKFSIPFAGDRPYIFVLRYNGTKKFVSEMYNYNSKNYDDDVKKLKELFFDLINKNKIIDILIYKDKQSVVSFKNIKIYYREIYNKLNKELNNVKISEQEAQNKIKSILNDFNISIDTNTIEKVSDYFFNIKYADNFYNLDDECTFPLLTLSQVKEKVEDIAINDDFNERNWEKLLKDAINTADKKNPIIIFWNLTRLMGNYIKGNSSQNWNNILRHLGYVGFADKGGRGIIHESEPTQAVFLTTSAFKVEEMIMNINPARNSLSSDTSNIKNGEYIADWDNGIWNRTDVKFAGENWFDGIFVNGTFSGDTFHAGTWKDGEWNGRYFNGTIWHNGIWNPKPPKSASIMVKATWENGVWYNGNFVNSKWYNGTWKEGNFKSSIWKNGLWENGNFVNGIWQNGTWEDGIWESGHWHNGNWKGGEWKGGSWETGKIYSKKFKKYIKSSVSPKVFYELENNYKKNEESLFIDRVY